MHRFVLRSPQLSGRVLGCRPVRLLLTEGPAKQVSSGVPDNSPVPLANANMRTTRTQHSIHGTTLYSVGVHSSVCDSSVHRPSHFALPRHFFHRKVFVVVAKNTAQQATHPPPARRYFLFFSGGGEQRAVLQQHTVYAIGILICICILRQINQQKNAHKNCYVYPLVVCCCS